MGDYKTFHFLKFYRSYFLLGSRDTILSQKSYCMYQNKKKKFIFKRKKGEKKNLHILFFLFDEHLFLDLYFLKRRFNSEKKYFKRNVILSTQKSQNKPQRSEIK